MPLKYSMFLTGDIGSYNIEILDKGYRNDLSSGVKLGRGEIETLLEKTQSLKKKYPDMISEEELQKSMDALKAMKVNGDLYLTVRSLGSIAED